VVIIRLTLEITFQTLAAYPRMMTKRIASFLKNQDLLLFGLAPCRDCGVSLPVKGIVTVALILLIKR